MCAVGGNVRFEAEELIGSSFAVVGAVPEVVPNARQRREERRNVRRRKRGVDSLPG